MNSLLHKKPSVAQKVPSPGNVKTIVQPKLYVNTPGDEYEQEADAMAERVMRMPANGNKFGASTGIIGASIQRKCTSCEEEDKKKKPIMRKTISGSGGMQASDSLVSSLHASKGGGSPLPQGTRSFMENAFSSDFSNIKIHTDSRAAEMSDGINAKAFTYGNDIYFNKNQYFPNNDSGKSLLVHELTHTVQQGNENNQILQRDNEIVVRGGGEERTEPPATIEPLDAEAAPSGGSPAVIPASLVCNPTPLSRLDFLARNGNDTSEFGHTNMTVSSGMLNPGTLQFQRIGRTRVKPLPIAVTLPNIDSIYTDTGTFREGTVTVLGGGSCPEGRYPIDYVVYPQGALKIRDGEQEHCDDYNLAYQLSVLPVITAVNQLAHGTTTFASERECRRRITRTVGFDPDLWFDKFSCLLRRSVRLRDGFRGSRGWHTPVIRHEPPSSRSSRYCESVRARISDVSFPEIGIHPSNSIIDITQC